MNKQLKKENNIKAKKNSQQSMESVLFRPPSPAYMNCHVERLMYPRDFVFYSFRFSLE